MYITICFYDSGLSVPSFSIISVRGSIMKAIEDAQKTIRDLKFMGDVSVYDIKEDIVKDIVDFSLEKRNILVFKACKETRNFFVFTEVFYEAYRHLIWNRKGTSKEHEKASTGMFRILIETGSGDIFQVYQDVADRDYAFSLCMKAVSTSDIRFQIFDDKGRFQIMNGKLIELQPA